MAMADVCMRTLCFLDLLHFYYPNVDTSTLANGHVTVAFDVIRRFLELVRCGTEWRAGR